MPRARRPPDRPTTVLSLSRAGRLTPEQIAKIAVAKRPSPIGKPDKGELAVKLVVPRAVAERLTERDIREQRNVEALIEEILAAAYTLVPRVSLASGWEHAPRGCRTAPISAAIRDS